jgi:hypothetical protein
MQCILAYVADPRMKTGKAFRPAQCFYILDGPKWLAALLAYQFDDHLRDCAQFGSDPWPRSSGARHKSDNRVAGQKPFE